MKKIIKALEYTIQVMVAVWIGLSVKPDSPYKVNIVLGLMILINLKYDIPNRIVEWYDKKNNR